MTCQHAIAWAALIGTAAGLAIGLGLLCGLIWLGWCWWKRVASGK